MQSTLRKHLSGVIAIIVFGFTTSAFAAAGHWDSAIVHLEAAKAEMQKAVTRGGKKDDAIQKIDEAIALLKSDSDTIKEKVETKKEKKKKN